MARDSCVEVLSGLLDEELWNSSRHGGIPPFVKVRPNRSGVLGKFLDETVEWSTRLRVDNGPELLAAAFVE